MKKRVFTLALALILCLSLLPMTALAAGTISLEKSDFTPGEIIVVTFSGITEQMISDKAFVGQQMNMNDVANAFGNEVNSRIEFSITIYNMTLDSIQPYCDKLTSNGFETLSTRSLFEGNITVSGMAYNVTVSISEISSNLSITYTFRTYMF